MFFFLFVSPIESSTLKIWKFRTFKMETEDVALTVAMSASLPFVIGLAFFAFHGTDLVSLYVEEEEEERLWLYVFRCICKFIVSNVALPDDDIFLS